MAARGTIAGGQPSGAYSISMEAIREFQIITNQYDVTYGAAGGGTISTVTKAGTNTLSGSAFNFARPIGCPVLMLSMATSVIESSPLINTVFLWVVLL
jgi:hypothetical protein